MATMAEVRQKYPQYSDMTDKDLATALHDKYYADMPFDQFSAKIGLATANEPTPASVQKREPFTGTILPIHRDENGNLSPAVPTLLQGMLDSGAAAVSAPYRAMTGQLPMTDDAGRTSPDAIAESTNMATWASPSSVAANTEAALAKNAGLTIANKAEKAAVSPRNQLLQSSERLGVKLPVAVASDSAGVQQLGKTVANVPLVGQPLRKGARDAISQLDAAATDLQNNLGTGGAVSAGNKIRSDVTSYAQDTLEGKIKDLEAGISATIDRKVPVPLSNTRATANKILAERQERAAKGDGQALNDLSDALSRDGMTFDGIRGKRADIRQLLKSSPKDLTSLGYNEGELKQVYSALTADLRDAALKLGGKEALTKFDEATGKEALIARDRASLQKVLGKDLSDEAITARIQAMASNNSRANVKDLLLTKKAVSPETWNEFSSAVIARMGRDQEGNLTPDRFITEYGKLSPLGKSALFDGETRQSLEDIAKVSSRFKQLNQYANPSGTGQTVGTVGAIFAGPLITIKAAIPGYITAKLLARPASAKTVADYVKAYELAAKAPGAKTQDLLVRRARELASVAANNNQNSAAEIFSKLSGVQKTAADQSGASETGQPEGQQQSTPEAQRFNDAYLQGNAL